MPQHRSISQLNSYTSCGEAYRLERIERVPSPPAAWTVRGIAVHETVRHWEASGRQKDPLELLEEEWAKALSSFMEKEPDLEKWIRTPRTKNTENDIGLRHKDAIQQVQDFVHMAELMSGEWSVRRLADGQLAVELPFEIRLPGCDFDIFGYIDGVLEWSRTGALTLVDYKTGGDAKENLRQLATYRSALKSVYGIDTRYGEYWYTKLNRSSGFKDLSRFDDDYLGRQYATLDRAIEGGIFLPNPSKEGCKFCSVKPFCLEMMDQ